MSLKTSWCCYCGEIHKEINNTSTISSYSKWQDEHEKKCAWKTQANEFFNTLTSEENMMIKELLTYFNSFKTLKEYLENDKDVSKIDQTGFYYGGSLSDQAKQIFEQLRTKYKSNNKREKERKREREKEREREREKEREREREKERESKIALLVAKTQFQEILANVLLVNHYQN